VTVATVANGTEKAENGEPAFKGAKTTIDFIDYTPELETKDNGRSWNIKRLTKSANEATHHTVMGMTAGMAALSAGNDFIGAATEGLSLATNTGADGVSAYAQLGGGSVRQETGSHVNMNTWNAILALGHANKKERSTFEYGAFFEYGSGNYTTHDGDNRGDGSVRNTGGGVLAKWTAAHGFYVEGSLRAGTVHDDASSVLRDAAGNAYGYDTNTGYWGAHIGAGKEILLANGNTLDVYGKFFYNRRNGVSFTANKSNFDLDAVTSEVLRVGARYTMKREKWNFYGGLAYEHELDGKATGTVNNLTIRSADIGGGSFRGELGATMQPGENSPWSLDLNVAGFAGKKQGVTGGVSVSFMF
jgi:outer membrane autotransporter protein